MVDRDGRVVGELVKVKDVQRSRVDITVKCLLTARTQIQLFPQQVLLLIRVCSPEARVISRRVSAGQGGWTSGVHVAETPALIIYIQNHSTSKRGHSSVLCVTTNTLCNNKPTIEREAPP